MFWGIDLSLTLGTLSRTVNARPALPFQPLKNLERYFTIPIQKIAHLFAPVLRQGWEEYAKIDLVWVAGCSHRRNPTVIVSDSKMALPPYRPIPDLCSMIFQNVFSANPQRERRES